MGGDCVSVNVSGLVSSLSLMWSESLHDTIGPRWLESEQSNTNRVRRAEEYALLEDTLGRHVLHARVTWRSVTAPWQTMLIGSVRGGVLSVCLCLQHPSHSAAQRLSEPFLPLPNAGKLLILTVLSTCIRDARCKENHRSTGCSQRPWLLKYFIDRFRANCLCALDPSYTLGAPVWGPGSSQDLQGP